MPVLKRGSVLRFFHWDAIEVPKPNRPGIVDDILKGRCPVYYGSTYKQGRAPKDAIIADPVGSLQERELASCLGAPVTERTYFHGSCLSEVDPSAQTNRYSNGRCPIDVLDLLEAQAEDRLDALGQAWERTRFLAPSVRVGLLQALWRRAGLSQLEELALTLLIFDGLKLAEIGRLRRSELNQIPLLPRTRELLRRWVAEPDATLGFVDIAAELASTWERLRLHLEKTQVCPTWDVVCTRMGGSDVLEQF